MNSIRLTRSTIASGEHLEVDQIVKVVDEVKHPGKEISEQDASLLVRMKKAVPHGHAAKEEKEEAKTVHRDPKLHTR